MKTMQSNLKNLVAYKLFKRNYEEQRGNGQDKFESAWKSVQINYPSFTEDDISNIANKYFKLNNK